MVLLFMKQPVVLQQSKQNDGLSTLRATTGFYFMSDLKHLLKTQNLVANDRAQLYDPINTTAV